MTRVVLFMCLLTACGPGIDREGTLTRLARAIPTEVDSQETLAAHNRLVEDVVEAGVLEGMTRAELTQRIGRAEQCGTRTVCSRRDFRPDDWAYDVGRLAGHPELVDGPTLIVGFDTAGRVIRTHYVTRERSAGAR